MSNSLTNTETLLVFICFVRGTGLFVGVDLVKYQETREPATTEAEHIIYRYGHLFSCDWAGILDSAH